MINFRLLKKKDKFIKWYIPFSNHWKESPLKKIGMGLDGNDNIRIKCVKT